MTRKKLTKKQQRQINKFALSNWKVLLVLFLLVAILTVVAYYMGWLDLLFNKNRDIEPNFLSTAGGYKTQVDEFGDLKITFLDVGQGDCIIIQLPDGKNMLIDSGDTSNDVEKSISQFTTANNIKVFDYILLTHADEDHVGNMDWVLDNYRVGFVFMPNVHSAHKDVSLLEDNINPAKVEGGKVSTTRCYMDFLLKTDAENCVTEIVNKDSDFTNKMIKKGTGEELSYIFNFLTPTADKDKIAYDNANDYSPIMYLEYAEKRIMFNGDAELDALEEYYKAYGDSINVDVLKVGHHGSDNAITEEFISAIDPEYAVIQCGIGNSYGHPKKDALQVIKDYDDNGKIELYRNDYNGDVLLKVNNNGEISWVVENEDMSNNWLDGEGQIVASFKRDSVSDGFMELICGMFVASAKKEII